GVVSYQYNDYGTTAKYGDADFYNEICYTSGVYDELTGLYYLNARYYSPDDQRFMSQDSYRGEQEDYATWNLYAYCGENPINYVDPSGHNAVVIVGVCATGYVFKQYAAYRKIMKKRIKISDLARINVEKSKKKFVVKIYNKALKMEWAYKIPAAIITAQACIESGYGKTVIRDKNTNKNSYNIFGIKAKKGQNYVVAKTKEYVNGRYISIDAKFAKYKNYNGALIAHAKLLKSDYKPSKNKINEWAYSLQENGYATDPNYARAVLDVISFWKLK
ncbi:MAG: glucosaminidase domain-containing protein, partial [Lachnospiraceae bacterium]|nr:glucosaminidase domain-containing protein [Lachnospiraceae bacterium]